MGTARSLTWVYKARNTILSVYTVPYITILILSVVDPALTHCTLPYSALYINKVEIARSIWKKRFNGEL